MWPCKDDGRRRLLLQTFRVATTGLCKRFSVMDRLSAVRAAQLAAFESVPDAAPVSDGTRPLFIVLMT